MVDLLQILIFRNFVQIKQKQYPHGERGFEVKVSLKLCQEYSRLFSYFLLLSGNYTKLSMVGMKEQDRKIHDTYAKLSLLKFET